MYIMPSSSHMFMVNPSAEKIKNKKVRKRSTPKPTPTLSSKPPVMSISIDMR